MKRPRKRLYIVIEGTGVVEGWRENEYLKLGSIQLKITTITCLSVATLEAGRFRKAWHDLAINVSHYYS